VVQGPRAQPGPDPAAADNFRASTASPSPSCGRARGHRAEDPGAAHLAVSLQSTCEPQRRGDAAHLDRVRRCFTDAASERGPDSGPLSTAKAPYLPFTGGHWGTRTTRRGCRRARPPARGPSPRTPGVFAVGRPALVRSRLTFVAAWADIDRGSCPRWPGQDARLDAPRSRSPNSSPPRGHSGSGHRGRHRLGAEGGEPLAIGYPRAGSAPCGPTSDHGAGPHPAAARLLVQFQLSEEFQGPRSRDRVAVV